MRRPLTRDDRVRLSYDKTRRGVVVVAGPEQSEVRWDGERRILIFTNSNLVRVVERVRSIKPRAP